MTPLQQQVAIKYLPLATKALRNLQRRWPGARAADLEGIDHEVACRLAMRYADDDEAMHPRIITAVRNAVVRAMTRASRYTQLQGDIPDLRQPAEVNDLPDHLRRFTLSERMLLERWSRYPVTWTTRRIANDMNVNYFRLWKAVAKLKKQPLA